MSPAAQIIIAVLSLIGIVLGAYATYRATVKSSQIEAEATPYTALAARVADLEDADGRKARQIRRLERRTRILVDALYTQYRWQEDGAKPPPPKIPEKVVAILHYEDTLDEKGNT